MAWYDFITDRTGAIGSKIMHQMAHKNRDVQVDREKAKLVDQSSAERVARDLNIKYPPPKETKIILDDGSVIWFDCATEMNHTFPSKVTEYPVEDGASVSDHIVNGNATFTVTGIFSDARLRKPDENGDSTLPAQPTQAETYLSLLDLRAKRKSFKLLTPLDTYTNIVLKSLGMPRDSGDALKVQMEFEQIRRAHSGITTVSLIDTAKAPAATVAPAVADTQDAGAVTPNNNRSDTTPLANEIGSLTNPSAADIGRSKLNSFTGKKP